MRITRLDLLRYGKFTDKSVPLPSAKKDFHLIVGPNEAGKSTLRNAIQDLLFGIETRSQYNFLHPYSDMRLGALIEHEETKLDFIRTKSRTKTLTSSTGIALPDNALIPFMGSIDRDFFEKMFGLNHDRMVKGGKNILNASDNIGQILFQAAAGIGNLSEIRNHLEAEADKLWSKNKSGGREYYIASDELRLADAALKQATVRTKDWQEAHSKFEHIRDALRLAQEEYRTLEQQRIQLERVRRIAPMLTVLIDLDSELTALGDVILLPENASEQLENAEHEIATATPSLILFEKKIAELRTSIDTINPDESILARSTDIESLSGMRQQFRTHESDIGKREEETRGLWQTIEESLRQLAWPDEGEDALAKRLPGSLIRSTIDNLIRRHELLDQTLSTAEEILRNRVEEIKVIDAEITALPTTEIPMTMIDALTLARSLGNVINQEKQIETQFVRLKRELETAKLQLGEWIPSIEILRKLIPPSLDEINATIKQRNDLELTLSTVKESLIANQAEIQSLQLEISQYKSTHHPVTLDDVRRVRAMRDSIWKTIKTGAASLEESASGYEINVAEADTVSDKRHDKAQEETELQSRLDNLQRLQQKMENLGSRSQETLQALTSLDQKWEHHIQSIGLTGMPLLQANEWRSARERVLKAADALMESQTSLDDFVSSVAQAKKALAYSLSPFNPDAQTLNLSALILLSDEMVNAATRAKERRDTISTQKIRAEAAIPDIKNRVTQAQLALKTWQTDLQKNLALAHLPSEINIGTIEGALDMFERIDQNLLKIRDIRTNRIDTMRRDLNDFTSKAKSLAAQIAPAIEKESPEHISLSLDSQLKQALSAAQDLTRMESELKKFTEDANAARSKIADAKAGLDPLLHHSNSSNNDTLRSAIQRSDRHRALTTEIKQSVKQMLQAGDGLDRESLAAEVNSMDASKIPILLSEIKARFDDVVSLQNKLSGELNSAESELGKIAGQNDAARAESQRQEALAHMSNVVERYIKVYTAGKLLRWSIERFRENKQGPMLARASDIYCGLTQGAFSRLVVDYESEPLELSGQRATGELVSIDGLSDGTRDQLYLALRLAALELHLEQTVPMPFIADDLFINYDDNRAKAGLEALAKLSESTQVIFLSHHEHLVSVAKSVFKEGLNVINLN